MESSRPAHIPVMPKEAIEALQLPQAGIAVDGTLGLGGHALLMAKQLGSQGRLIGLDRDATALSRAGVALDGVDIRRDLMHANFSSLDKVLADLQLDGVDGILLDLGISSFQLDNPNRGFSFKSDGPLDMRMNVDEASPGAQDLVNTLSEEALVKIITEYGEERFARRIAAAVVVARAQSRITRTVDLAGIVLRALPRGYTRGRIHPATRTFQALRIAVNKELESLALGLDVCFKMLKQGGRLCVISFHSLEDRCVKNTFKSLSALGQGQIITKRPMVASRAECLSNPRSRSAKMRVIERIG